MRVVVDSQEGPELVDLWGDVVFSPDGSRIAYLAQRRGRGVLGGLRRQWVAVVDGNVGDGWDEVASNPHFSPDSTRVAFSGRRGKAWSIVIDGVPGPAFNEVGPPRFSASGRLAYVGRTGESYVVVFDGAKGPSFENPYAVVPGKSFLLSPNGEHVAAVGQMQGAWRPIVDDYVGPAYPGVGRVLFDAQRVIFHAIDGRGVHRISIDV